MRPDKSPRVFAHSYQDGWLVLVAAAELGIVVYACWRFSILSIAALAVLALLSIFLNCTNYQCVAHNFIHNPFFRSRLANAGFSVFNTLALGVPQTLYREHHLNHHQYNNLVAADGRTDADMSSIYRYSKRRDRPENIVGYAVLGPVRADFVHFTRLAVKHGYAARLAAEVVGLAALWIGLLAYDWRYFVWFYLPVWYFGQIAAYAENYLEHYKAVLGNEMADSVSCYGKFYNLIWFHNGYHQEHHHRPQVHWTRVADIREQMLPVSERRVVRWAHWFNF
jgi:fatty acid desaturase